jgi:hypothetical protein
VKRKLVIFVVALPFIISLVFLAGTKRPASLAAEPLPNPNGYDNFVKAAGMIKGNPKRYKEMGETNLAELIATNADALALVKSAFTNECRVPLQLDPSSSARDYHFVAFDNLTQTMTAEARFAELQNSPMEAADDYLNVIHFGTEVGRGGNLVAAMIGNAAEATGQDGLESMTNRFDAVSCRAIAAALESLDRRRQTWDAVVLEDDTYRNQIHSSLMNYITVWLSLNKEYSEARRRSEELFHETERKTRSLTVQFAARAYELEKGKPPTSIADLVPAYLKAIPKDPTTGKDMAYP